MTKTTLRALLQDSRDGEWGKGEPGPGRRVMSVIRGTDFPAVRVGDLAGVPRRYLEERHATRKRVQPWDILIETAGGSPDRPTGRTLLLKPNLFERLGPDVTCASFARFLRIDDAKADPRFVFWMLQHHYEARDLLQFHTQHTGVARFQFTTFAESFVLTLPDRETQSRIAAILSPYDDLIEVNRRRIALLEEMARRLFEEWFVHFRFPGHEGVRFAAIGGVQLPQDWSMQRLGDLTSVLARGIAPKYDEAASTLVVSQKCIRDQRLSLAPARRQSRPAPREKLVHPGDVLVNSTGVGTLGRTAQAEQVPPGLTVDTHVTIVRPLPQLDRDYFGLALLRLEPLFERLGVGATGQTELTRSHIADVEIAVPPLELQQVFGRHARQLRSLAFKLGQQNERLAASRDLLLPRLISGELTVAAAERDLEAAA